MTRRVPQLIQLSPPGYWFLESDVLEDGSAGEILVVVEEAADVEDAERLAVEDAKRIAVEDAEDAGER